ncbi:hypothetical protein QCN17_13215, partial [Enterobacter asburiae]
SERIPAAAGIVNLRYKSCPEMAGQDHYVYRYILGAYRAQTSFCFLSEVKYLLWLHTSERLYEMSSTE